MLIPAMPLRRNIRSLVYLSFKATIKLIIGDNNYKSNEKVDKT